MFSAEADPNASPGERVLQLIRKRIQAGTLPPGAQVPPELKLAAESNVARETVRGALRQLETEGLIRKLENGRRVVASTTDSSAILTDTIVVVTDLMDDVDGCGLAEFESEVYAGATSQIAGKKLSYLSLRPAHADLRRLESILQCKPRGVLVLRTDHTGEVNNIAKRCAKHGVPLVFVDEPWQRTLACDVVGSDHRAGTRELVRYLHAKGCRRILQLWHWMKVDELDWLKFREAGYTQACAELGIEALAPVVCGTNFPDVSPAVAFDRQAELVAGVIMRLEKTGGKVDAIMTISDGFVPRANAGARLMGRIPGKDIFVAGYDNYWAMTSDRILEPTPPAVTVSKRNRRLGALAANVLLDRASGERKGEPQMHWVAPRLVTEFV